MKLLHRTPAFVALLVVLAAGGGAAGAALGHRTPPDATPSAQDSCLPVQGAHLVTLLPAAQHVEGTSVEAITEEPAFALTRSCTVSTGAARVTLTTQPLGPATPAQWEQRFAGAHHLTLTDAARVSTGDGGLVWPGAALVHFTCRVRGAGVGFGSTVSLGGSAGRGTHAPREELAALLQEVTRAAQDSCR